MNAAPAPWSLWRVDAVQCAVSACLRLPAACNGLTITTGEGLGSQRTGASAADRILAEVSRSQCGLCTSGWITAKTPHLADHSRTGNTLTHALLQTSVGAWATDCANSQNAFAEPADAAGEVDKKPLAAAIKESCGPCHDVRTKAPCGRLCDSKAVQVSPPSTTAGPQAITRRDQTQCALHFRAKTTHSNTAGGHR